MNAPAVSSPVPDRLLDRRQAAEMLGVAPQTLAGWACRGRYSLRFIKVGKLVKYRASDLEKFIESRSATHTGELASTGI
jgi:predicted site-specific integrase-resolvase